MKANLDGLRRAGAPLLLPILFVALVASFHASRPVQGIVWVVTALVLLHFMTNDEGSNYRRTLTALGEVAARWPFILVTLAILVWGIQRAADKHHSGLLNWYETWGRGLLYASGLYVLFAALLRLAWFANTLLRLLIALAVLVVGARVALAIVSNSVFSRDTSLSVREVVAWMAVPAGLLILTAFCEALIPATSKAKFLNSAPASLESRHTRWRQRGIDLAIVAGLAFAVAAIFGEKADPSVNRRLELKTESVGASRVLTHPPSTWLKRNAVGSHFAPVLELTAKEGWQPERVDTFVTNATLHWASNGGPLYKADKLKDGHLTLDSLPVSCPVPAPSSCLYLTINCPADPMGATCKRGSTARPPKLHSGGTAYVRLVGSKDEPDQPFGRGIRSVGPYAGKVSLLLQYWLFYYYDDWEADSLLGDIRQAHEADWEAVTIGFSSSKPLFVALSSHCGGTWVPWEDIDIYKAKEGFHPVVAVAQGSHANYHTAAADIPPDWTGCIFLHSRKASVASFAYRIRDRTGVGSALRLTDLFPADAAKPPMSFPGVWGKNGVAPFTMFGGKSYNLPIDADGPKTPTLQPLWYDPMWTIFCAKTWEARGSGKDVTCVKRKKEPPR